MRNAIDRFMSEARELAGRLSGASAPTEILNVRLDFDAAQAELHEPAPHIASSDEYFERQWTHSIFEMAIDALERECQMHGLMMHFRLFERADLEGIPASVEDLASEFRLPAYDVAEHLMKVRRQLRTIILDNLKLLTGSEPEYRSEARLLLGIEPA